MKKIIVPILSFIAGFAVLMSVMYIFRPEKSGSNMPVAEIVTQEFQHKTQVLEDKEVPQIPDSAAFPRFVVDPYAQLIVTKDEYHYNISAEAVISDSTEVVRYELRSSDGILLSESEAALFSNIAPGSYVVVAYNASIPQASVQTTVQCIERKPIDRITPEQLSAIYNSGDYNGNKVVLQSKIVSTPRITYNGMDTSNELNEMPDTHQQLCQKIYMGAWQSITVTNITYNVLGVATAFNINYKKSE